MTGSSDGVIKVFRGYESKQDVELVTSFRALTDLEQSTKSAGLVFEWQQSRGQVLVAGDVRSIRVWNAGTEICTAVSFPFFSFTALLPTNLPQGHQRPLWLPHHLFNLGPSGRLALRSRLRRRRPAHLRPTRKAHERPGANLEGAPRLGDQRAPAAGRPTRADLCLAQRGREAVGPASVELAANDRGGAGRVEDVGGARACAGVCGGDGGETGEAVEHEREVVELV